MSEFYTTIADELASGASVTYFTVGSSMRPLLRERMTHVTLIPPQDFRIGDILLYIRPNGQYVLHRLIEQSNNICYMRGDNTYGLEPVSITRVIGVVTHIYRRGRMFDTQNKAYRAYVFLWSFCYPLRWLLWKIRRSLGRIKHKFKKGI